MSKAVERRETGEGDLFRSRVDQIIDMKHELVRLARAIDWPFLEERFGEVYKDGAGMPPLPTRLMAGLAILKHRVTPVIKRLMRRRSAVVPVIGHIKNEHHMDRN
jgi:hypothetical protein